MKEPLTEPARGTEDRAVTSAAANRTRPGRPLSKLAPDWWDYTTLDPDLLADAARVDERRLRGFSRPGFSVHFHFLRPGLGSVEVEMH